MEVSLDNYMLSCELWGHSMDVRSVASGTLTAMGQAIFSGSRDKMVKVWKPKGNEYREAITLRDHTNFISCVYYLDSEQWICTGSNDSNVCIYREHDYQLLVVLKGHESNVCSISCGVDPMSLITGSWDKTARIWTIDQMGGYKYIPLIGHDAAVWAVASVPSVKKYITGSADNTIYYWNSNGDKLNKLKGHTDCVRGILVIGTSLISCANDAIIRCWNEDGKCVQELNGHSNYIYAVAQNKSLGNDIVVSCGEDNTLRMWNIAKGIELGSPIVHPAQSVWSVTCLRNSDIVTGSSDGIIRVFTKDHVRVANTTTLAAFQNAVSVRHQQQQQSLGGIKKTDLPGPESLLSSGSRDGQTKMVHLPDGTVKCYIWKFGKWDLVGDVTGASGENQYSSAKKLHEGKEYDFVFSVDISDTEPPIKLPYNHGDDPWRVAQSFIHTHNMPQTYLEQVANFIIKNSGYESQQETLRNYEDPFTGVSRYVPGTSNALSSTGFQKHFPVYKYVTFDNYDRTKVLDKLKEFNKKLTNTDGKVSDILLEAVIKLTDTQPEIDKSTVEALQHILSWPSDILFPVLDVTRLAIRSEAIFKILNCSNFLNIVLPKLSSTVPNQLMIVRCLANMMSHEAGRMELDIHMAQSLDLLKNIKSGSANLEIALSTFYLNLSISQTLGTANEEKCLMLIKAIIELLKWVVDLEACYRLIQAIGNLTRTPYGAVVSAQINSVNFVIERISELTNTPHTGAFEKLNDAGKELLDSF